MIDLKKLERKIDALLAQETSESLNSWYSAKLVDNLESYLGDGDYVESGIMSVDAFAQPENTDGMSFQAFSYSNAA